jgi:hypothetical protein
MRYLVLQKMKYIRGIQYDMPPMGKDGFPDLATAEGAKAALETLEQRPDLVSYVIVKVQDEKN